MKPSRFMRPGHASHMMMWLMTKGRTKPQFHYWAELKRQSIRWASRP